MGMVAIITRNIATIGQTELRFINMSSVELFIATFIASEIHCSGIELRWSTHQIGIICCYSLNLNGNIMINRY
jgi:hypothetical protein